MLAVGLLFVGITLIGNGYCGLVGVNARSIALLNLLTGILSFLINTFFLLQGEYFSAGTGFLFSFTYLLLAFSYIFDLDMRVYGIFALFVAINTLPSAYLSYSNGEWRLALLWLFWSSLWFCGFIEHVLCIKIGKPVMYLAIFLGLFTCWIPGYFMLAGWW